MNTEFFGREGTQKSFILCASAEASFWRQVGSLQLEDLDLPASPLT